MEPTFLKSAEELLPLLAGKRFLLIHGHSFESFPFAEELRSRCAAEFTGFSPNPTLEEAQAGLRVFQEQGCDGILAVGGGSAMDTAKCIRCFANTAPESCDLRAPVEDTGVPLYALPTTAGSGSESTRYSVIVKDGAKISLSDESLLPAVVVLEPSVLASLPLFQKKCTLLDALCQAIEALWSIRADERSDALARESAELIRDHWRDYIFRNDPASFEPILRAANLSGQAIHITATTAGHAMSYALTTLYGVAHGLAVATIMAKVWPWNIAHMEDCADPRGAAHLERVLNSLPISYEQFLEMLEEMELRHPVCGAKWEDLPKMCASVNPVRLKNHPVTLRPETIEALYRELIGELGREQNP